MQFYLLKRLLMTVAVLILMITFLSVVIHIIPGDPAMILLGPRANPATIAKMRAAMELDKSVPAQVASFFSEILHGTLGIDVITGRPINMLIASALPHTLILAFASLSLAAFIGGILGVFSATHPDSWLDRTTAILSISFISIPSYVCGLFLLLVFAVKFRVMPAIGLGENGDAADYIKHLILPAFALAIPWIGYLARLVRASLLEVLNEAYIRSAMAAGLSQRLVYYKYALKNSLISVVAILGVGLGNLMGGAIFVELIFSRPGMGTLIYNAIGLHNFPLVRAGVMVVALLFVLANLLADLSYTYLDPRIEFGRARG